MKFYYIKIILSVAILFSLISCDEVSKPYLQDGGDVVYFQRKILLEDYTGYKCGNCPEAHLIANGLHEKYGDTVIIVAVHAGFFATTDPKHPYDFKTPAGTEWDKFFGISAAALPKGMVNRFDYLNSSHILSKDSWNTVVDSLKGLLTFVKIDLDASYNSANGQISIDVDYQYSEPLAKYHNLNVIIVEDSIVNYQKWYNHTPEEIEDYVHNHVLRTSVNGSWGEELTTQNGNKKYSLSISGKDWRPEKLKVIAFISDVGDTYEIFQAEEVDLK